MAQTGYTPIQLYYSSTASAVPLAANLAAGELAINTTDGKLYYKSNAGVVTLIAGATSGPAGGSNTQVQYNSSGVLAGSANMTFNGTTLTVAGLSNTGNTILGDASADTVTINGTITSNLIFTDNTYDIGASGATRPRSLFLGTALTTGTTANIGTTATVGTSLTVTGTGTNPMYLGTGTASLSTYGLLTFNANTAYTTTIGMYGGGGTDGSLYLAAASGGSINMRVAGIERLLVSNFTAAFSNNTNGSVGYTATNTDVTDANSRASFTANSGTVQTQLLSVGSQGIGYFGTLSNHPLNIFTNGNSRVAISINGLVTLGTTLPTAAATYNALTVGGTGISIAPDGNAKLQIGRYNSGGANWSYLKPDSTSTGFKFSSSDDLVDLMSLRSSDGLLVVGRSATVPGAWDTGYNALSFATGGVMSGKNSGATYMFGNSTYLATGGWVSQNSGSMIGLIALEGDGPKIFVTALASSAGQTLNPVAVSRWNVNGQMVMAGGSTDATSPSGRLTVISNTATYASPTDQAIWARNGSASAGTIVSINAADSGNNVVLDMYVNSAYNQKGTIFYYRGADTIVYGTGGPTVSAPFNTQFSKYGVTFNATTIQSGDPNTLDDYEEGTWAPTMSYGGTNATLSPSYGHYVKVGQVVTLTGYFNVNNLNGGSGNATLTGLPFTIGATADYYPGFWFGYTANANFAAGFAGISGYGVTGSKSIYVGSNNNVAWQQGNNTTLPATVQIGPFTLTYITTD
jgi:hypothetical protein